MRNFGKIKNIYNSILVEGMYRKDPKKKALFKKYLKTIKENKILRTQFQVYRNIESKVESDDSSAREYVKENIELLKKFKKKDIIEANMLLVSDILYEVDEDYDKKELHEEITNLIFTDKNPKNIDSIMESTSKIVDVIKENVEVEPIKEDVIPTKILTSISVEKFNERYSDLSEEEKRVLKSLINGNDNIKEETLKTLVGECIDLVDNQLDGVNVETKAKLLEVKDKLLRMKYDEESFITDIGKVMDLKTDLSAS